MGLEQFYTETVTVWNRKKGSGAWDTDQWYPTVIRNARLIISKGNNVMKSGIENADTARLHISDTISKPDKPYADPIAWKEAPGTCYTLESENGSFFTRGDTSGETVGGSDFFETMKQKVADCYRISTADRFEMIPHFEVYGR